MQHRVSVHSSPVDSLDGGIFSGYLVRLHSDVRNLSFPRSMWKTQGNKTQEYNGNELLSLFFPFAIMNPNKVLLVLMDRMFSLSQ